MVILLGIVGFFLGAIVGGALGVGIGLAWVEIFRVSSFEGGAGMLVFLAFMPIGALLGAIAGVILMVRVGASGDQAKHPGAP